MPTIYLEFLDSTSHLLMTADVLLQEEPDEEEDEEEDGPKKKDDEDDDDTTDKGYSVRSAAISLQVMDEA